MLAALVVVRGDAHLVGLFLLVLEGAPVVTEAFFPEAFHEDTFFLVRSFQRIVRSTNITLENGEVFLRRESRPTAGRRVVALPASGRNHLLACCGLYIGHGLLSRPVRAQSSRWHKTEHLRRAGCRQATEGPASSMTAL
jgi:hypothetical protein